MFLYAYKHRKHSIPKFSYWCTHKCAKILQVKLMQPFIDSIWKGLTLGRCMVLSRTWSNFLDLVDWCFGDLKIRFLGL